MNPILINEYDDTLKSDIALAVSLYKDRLETAERLRNSSYEQRFAEFLRGTCIPRTSFGFLHWYKKLDKSLMFLPRDLDEYFDMGEPIPVICPGSIWGMRARYYANRHGLPKYAITEIVFMRYLKYIRFTCTSFEEYQDYLCTDGMDVLRRIMDKHNSPPVRDVLILPGDQVYINGVRRYVKSERALKSLREYHQVVQKLERLESK